MFERTMAKAITDASRGFAVVLLTGQRQVGKSTLLCGMLDSKKNYVSLDNFADRQLAKTNPEGFLQKYSPPVIIDEVQYAPELFTYIKIWVDENKFAALKGEGDKPRGAFWLTGSQKYTLMKNVQESMAGRVAILEMLGFSYKEIIGKPTQYPPFVPSMALIKRKSISKPLTTLQVFEHIWKGSFPELIADEQLPRKRFYDSYIQTYITRDVKDFYNIDNELAFYNLLVAVAARTGELLNYDNLATTARIDKRTCKLWLEILERSGIIYLLQPYSGNINKRLIKTPKVYFMDTGLAAYLTNWHTPDSLMTGAQSGHFLETYIFGEILKSYLHNGEKPAIYFYRNSKKKKREIDFILEHDNVLHPIEVKQTNIPTSRDAGNFTLLADENKPIGTGAVICMTNKIIPIENLDAISFPVWEI